MLLAEFVINAAGVPQARIGQGKIRIKRNRLFVHLHREFQAQLSGVAARAQKMIVSLKIFCRLLRQRLLFLRRERNTQRLGDAAGDLVLYFEDVFELAVIALRPHRVPGGGLYQLRSDAQAVAGAPDAAAEHVGGVQLLAHLRRCHLSVAVRQHLRPRENSQSRDFRKFGDHVLGHAVAEIFVLFGAAQILEIQHRHGFFRRCLLAVSVGGLVTEDGPESDLLERPGEDVE